MLVVGIKLAADPIISSGNEHHPHSPFSRGAPKKRVAKRSVYTLVASDRVPMGL